MRPSEALPHPAEWKKMTVGDAVEVKRGVSWSKEQESSLPREGAVPVIRISNVQDRLELHDLLFISGLKPKVIEKKRVSADWSILVGSNGNRARIGNAVYVADDTDMLFASFLIAAKPKAESEITPKFFYRWLRTEQVQSHLSASSEGSTGLSNLSHSFFNSMAIAHPERREQEVIALLLDSVDSAIDIASDSIQSAMRLKQAVTQDFFISALGDTAYANRPNRGLPEGWSLLPTNELILGEPKNGVSPTTFSQPPGTPTFSIAAIRDGRVDLAKTEHLKFAMLPAKIADKFRIAKGDVLIVRGNANPDLVGKAGQITTFPEGCIYPDITIRVKFRENIEHPVTPEYAVLAWNHPVVHNQILRRAKTSNGTLKINKQDVKQMILPVPPLDEQESITRLAGACDQKKAALSERLSALEELKKSLMHDLLTGTVRVDPRLFKEEEQA